MKSWLQIHSVAFAALSLYMISFLVYLETVAPGVYGFDSAELATGVYTQGVVHPPGYPLYLLIGKIFSLLPVRDIAFRLNLMSAFFGALTVVLLFLAIRNMTANDFAAGVAALFFGISNYFWQMSLVAEVYTAFTAFLAADLLIVVLWRKTGSPNYLLLFSLVYGLSLTIHTSGVLFAPAFAWLILSSRFWKKRDWAFLPVMLALFTAGLALPYCYLALRASTNPPLNYLHIYTEADLSTLPGLWWYFSGRAYSIFAFGYRWEEIPDEVWRFAGFLWRNFLGVGVLLGAAGIVALWRQSRAWATGLLLMFAANAIFYINYRVMDKDTMFLPAYEVWAIFIAAGLVEAGRLLERFHPVEAAFPRIKVALPVLVLMLGIGLNWRWVDMSHADSYIRFGNAMMAHSAPNSVIIAPWSSAVVLEYYQIVDGRRPDLLIINRSRRSVARFYELSQYGLGYDEIMSRINAEEVSFIDQNIGQRTVYAVEYDPALARKFEYLPENLAFRLARH